MNSFLQPSTKNVILFEVLLKLSHFIAKNDLLFDSFCLEPKKKKQRKTFNHILSGKI